MREKIDVFLPCVDNEALLPLVNALTENQTVCKVTLLDASEVVATDTIKNIAETAKAEYVLLSLKPTPVTLGMLALERMLRVAADTESVMLYSDHYSTHSGVVERHPVIDYQEGSVRDDFDCGQLVLIRTDMLKEYAAKAKADLSFAAFYDLRLYLSRHGRIFHLGEYLYTEEEMDLRKSGEKQFDYVNPRNREVQVEMEKVATWHLEKIGALVDTTVRRELDFMEQDFPVEASVVIPVFNREKTVADAIKSALAQKTDFEYNVIVVDNHSTDGTTAIIRKCEGYGTRLIHIIPERTDLGIGGCWNMAIQDSRCGRFAVQLDSDDLYSSPNTLQKVVDTFYKEKAAMVIGAYRMCDFDLNTLPPGIIDHREWTDENGPNNALRINGLGAPRAFFTPMVRQFCFPNTSYGEDYAMGLAFSRAYRIGRIYDELYLCRRWGGNSDAALSQERVNANNLYKDSIRTMEISARRQMNSGAEDIMEDSGLRRFFSRQLDTWDDTRHRYSALRDVQTRDLNTVKVQFNPSRIVSTGAKIDKKTLSQRPCFLCAENRPTEQMHHVILDGKGEGSLELLVNPFPILPMHFTLPSLKHEEQRIVEYYDEVRLLLDNYPGMMVFYNGARCGASAPDHRHFQAGSNGIVPLQTGWNRLSRELQLVKELPSGDRISLVRGYVCPAFAIQSKTAEGSSTLFACLVSALSQKCPIPYPDAKAGEEPMMNVIAWRKGDEDIIIVIPRGKHRPDCYNASGDEQFIVSPGALDMAGLIITPRQEDFERMTQQKAESILQEVAITWDQAEAVAEAMKGEGQPVIDRLEEEPDVRVGIVSATSICFSLNGIYRAKGEEITGEQSVEISEGVISWRGVQYRQLTFHPVSENASFSIFDVVIGVNFHWERKQTQTFLGTLRLVVEEEKICAINELPVERYLESVISSEMSATSSLELLKAHAVISRSWLLAQMEKRRKNSEAGGNNFFSFVKKDNCLIKWYDREDHTIFDVCADDHCQRYQGITNTVNPNVVEAVKATRGQILAYDGEICDTRFSKCCGGVTEEYQYCWENIRKPYLVSVSDPYCNTSDKRILSQVLNDYDQETINFYTWEETLTQDKIRELLSQKLHLDLGFILNLEPVEVGKSGRISQLKIVGTKGSFTVGKELEIRRVLSDSHLYSSAFTVEVGDDLITGVSTEGIPSSFILHGKGWGHGVGLCQIGAAVMGEQGFAYDDILLHYYQNAEIAVRY